jgi:hypothetical protein
MRIASLRGLRAPRTLEATVLSIQTILHAPSRPTSQNVWLS